MAIKDTVYEKLVEFKKQTDGNSPTQTELATLAETTSSKVGTALKALDVDGKIEIPKSGRFIVVGGKWVEPGSTSTPPDNLTIVFDNALAPKWVNTSWSSTVSFPTVTDKVIDLLITNAWGALYLYHTEGFTPSNVNVIKFSVYGKTTPKPMRIHLVTSGDAFLTNNSFNFTPVQNSWKTIEIPLRDLGYPNIIKGIVIQDMSGSAGQNIYIDNLGFSSVVVPELPAQDGPDISISLTEVRPIDDNIYGMNFADEALAAELSLPINRWGGNGTTRYNYEFDTASHTVNWYFENIPKPVANENLLPEGSAANKFIEANQRTNTNTLLTVPLIGWTPKSRAYAGGFSVSKYGPQQSVDPWRPDYGNGIKTNGSFITGNDPTDTSKAIDELFVIKWLTYLKSRFGNINYLNLDNEPMLWNETHRDVHPNAVGYDEIKEKTIRYAKAIKQFNPNVKLLGPVLWGWAAYFWSALDKVEGGNNWYITQPDRNRHGGQPFIEWYLTQMKQAEQQNNVRLLDYVDLHFYPTGNGVFNAQVGDNNIQALRLRSTRDLWDRSYKNEGWINEPVYLIPRMKDWVNTFYPGTKTAMTEYNWGALNSVNGALTQADILGIFGQEGLDLATLWDSPKPNDPGAYAFRMYRNYDGNKSKFGTVSLKTTSSNRDKLAVYAAKRSDGKITVIMINKTGTPLKINFNFQGVNKSAKVFVYDGEPTIKKLSDVQTNTVITLKASSITCLEL